MVAAALESRATVRAVFVGRDAGTAENLVSERALERGVDVRHLADGVAARIGSTTTPQGIFALVELERRGTDALAGITLAVVAPAIGDPGNAGTLVRSAAATGAEVIVLGPGSVDAYNHKTVRASAGACFALQIVEGVPAVKVLEALGSGGVRRVGAVPSGGRLPEQVDLAGPVALVVGHEIHGLAADLPLDELVTIPMHGTESLNVAMAGTILLYEAARQRRAAT